MTLREEFIASLNVTSDLDLLMQNNNSAYIDWLENKIRVNVEKTKCDCGKDGEISFCDSCWTREITNAEHRGA